MKSQQPDVFIHNKVTNYLNFVLISTINSCGISCANKSFASSQKNHTAMTKSVLTFSFKNDILIYHTI